jgi:hypothetical protein
VSEKKGMGRTHYGRRMKRIGARCFFARQFRFQWTMRTRVPGDTF